MAIITGTVGSDILNGTAAADVITGLESNDVMNGKAGDDDFIVKGGHGADYINGGADYDQLIVSSDFFTTYASVVLGYIDYVEGFHLDELSQDLKILASGTSMVKLNSFTTFTTAGASYLGVFGDSANNSISGFNIASIQDHLHGAGGNDQIYGNGGDDYLYGEAGNDSMLAGGAGNDTISGGSGTDWLDGGAGDDALTGGTEADQFRFNLNAANGTDTITDFQDGTDLISVYAPTGISINDLTITPINGGADTEIFYTNGTVSTTIEVAWFV